MAKYDCTKAKDFLHEAARVKTKCHQPLYPNSDCIDKCPMKLENGICIRNRDISSALFLYFSDEEFNDIVSRLQKWSDNHPEKRELTEDEKNILKAFKALGYTYIATDSIGYVRAYISKPKRGKRMWYNTSIDYGYVCEAEKFFGGIVSWEDEEPAKIEDLLKEVEQK